MSLSIRPATLGDIPALFAIRTAVRENHMTLAALAAAGVTPDSVAELLRSEDAATWIGLWDGEPAAFAMARSDQGDVFALFVRPEMEGRGFGGRLLALAESWLASRGAESAWLLTGGEPGLKAARFYAARGWLVEGREPDGQLRFTKRLAARS
ncbi:GNAT family N-acetyltransferase [Microvirga lenta]|uniref:GNAT family N-acetyltransferase n=1 Tax=Microvirga lenta TaxID=2881337 RepID=UPI001CFC861B|nr:GNAT family N-acetyltransferase [Microvirga lenta]MCB5174735.1 GNAT family N-acetyltransferase [Microvirga lenta]